ncbi:uncharacterized protein ACIQIH_000613 isoform 2-T2 [Cyanocitta cristata]
MDQRVFSQKVEDKEDSQSLGSCVKKSLPGKKALGLGWWELSEKREGNCNVQLHSWRKDQDGRGKAVELLGARGKQKDLSTQRQQRESWRRRWKTLSLPWWNSWETESSRSSKNRVGSRLQPAKDIQNCHLPLTDSRNVLRSSCFGMGTAVGSSGRSSTQRQQRESWRRRWKTLSLPWWNSWETESSRSSKNRVGSRLQPAKNTQNCHLPLTDSRNVLRSSCFGMGTAVGSSGRSSTQRQQRESWRRRWKTLSLPWWNSWETESSRSSKNRVGSRLQPGKADTKSFGIRTGQGWEELILTFVAHGFLSRILAGKTAGIGLGTVPSWGQPALELAGGKKEGSFEHKDQL